jgi:hypothetical protein
VSSPQICCNLSIVQVDSSEGYTDLACAEGRDNVQKFAYLPQPLNPFGLCSALTLCVSPCVCSRADTQFHACAEVAQRLQAAGFVQLSERQAWGETVKPGARCFFMRNGSTIVAFAVGQQYKPGNGVYILGQQAVAWGLHAAQTVACTGARHRQASVWPPTPPPLSPIQVPTLTAPASSSNRFQRVPSRATLWSM